MDVDRGPILALESKYYLIFQVFSTKNNFLWKVMPLSVRMRFQVRLGTVYAPGICGR